MTAPGPDGYSMAFSIKGWDVIGSDVIAAIQNFHDQEVFERRLNVTFVALIPKKVGAVELNDFSPFKLIDYQLD